MKKENLKRALEINEELEFVNNKIKKITEKKEGGSSYLQNNLAIYIVDKTPCYGDVDLGELFDIEEIRVRALVKLTRKKEELEKEIETL